jgi:hypothetical protein
MMSHEVTRRSLLRGAAALAGGSVCGITTASEARAGFHHRGYLGWITDLATEPDPTAAWPSMRLDERLLDDYRRTFDLMRRLDFNEISIWGLYVSRSWPVDITSAVDPNRGAMVESDEEAHQRSIRVYSVSAFSWGFEEIIRRTAAQPRQCLRCARSARSRLMQRGVDFVFARFAIDGVSMQSATRRCRCEQCQAHTDAQYHALLNTRTAEYIRGRYAGKTIGVNSWGLGFQDENGLPVLTRMSKQIDYLIDGTTAAGAGPGLSSKLIGL